GVKRLHPVERGRRVGKFAGAMVEFALAAPDTTEIEAQYRKVALLEHVEEIIHDLVVHRTAELRMRMENQCDRRILLLRRLIAAFETTGWSGKDYLGHGYSKIDVLRFGTFRDRLTLCS